MDHDTCTTGQRIKAARKSKGWTQLQLATRTYVSHSRISDIEKDQCHDPQFWVMVEIAKALGISLDYLAYGDK